MKVISSRVWMVFIVVVAACASGGKESPDGQPGLDASQDNCTELGEETCNGNDDDCDGHVDETFTMLGMECMLGRGACERGGHYVCSSDHTMTVCDAVAGDPVAESCNGDDDDCDGMADEGFMLAMPCDGADGDLCADGIYMCDGQGMATCTDDSVSHDEVCNGMDDNCNGTADEGFNVGTSCDGSDSDSCMRGQVACNGSGGVTCVADMPNSIETCNNADDDCNGVIDNGFNKTSDINNCGSCGTVCTNAHGSTSCSSSVCAPVCTAFWGDMDSSRTNGCECDGNAYEPSNLVGTTGGNWVNLGNTYSDCDHYHSWQANIVPTTDDDFYEAYIANDSLCVWETKLYLSQIPAGADYDLELYRWNGSSWDYLTHSIAAGNANEAIDMSSYDEAWYGFRVIRYSGSSCSNYKLSLCDGSGACGP